MPMTDEVRDIRRMEVEDKMVRYFQNKEIIKERTEENKMLKEEIDQFVNDMGSDLVVAPLPNGEFAVLRKRVRNVDKLDRKGLALRILVAPDELKTPFDYSMFTQQGKLTPRLITDYTETETKTTVSLTRRKKAPRD